MSLSDLPDLMPQRSYDDLLAGSMRRGRRLRTRRRILQTTPVAAVLALAAAFLPGALAGHAGADQIKLSPAVPNHTPAPHHATTPHQPLPPPLPPARGGSATVTPSGSGSRPILPTQQHSGGQVPSDTAAPAPSTVIHQARSVVLSYADPTGDGNPGGGKVAASSDPAMDITRMRFDTTLQGIRVTMFLLGDYRVDGAYRATWTDARNGCMITLTLGGPIADQVQWTCGATVGGKYLPPTADPSARELIAVLPYNQLPGGVRATDLMKSISGTSYLTGGAGETPFDTASTAKTWTPR